VIELVFQYSVKGGIIFFISVLTPLTHRCVLLGCSSDSTSLSISTISYTKSLFLKSNIEIVERRVSVLSSQLVKIRKLMNKMR